MSSLQRDLQYAVRSFRLAPGFTAVALIVLTLGIGATTAIFSVVDAVVLRPLPFPDAKRLIDITEVSVSGKGYGGSVTPQNFFDWKARQGGVFEDLAAVGGMGLTFRDRAEPELLQAIRVSASLFGMLRVQPERGRLFTADNEVDGNHRVLMISDGLWRRRFGADPTIVGRAVKTSDGVWLIVGVMPRGFEYPVGHSKPIDVWAPYVGTPEEHRRDSPSHSSYLTVVGRLSAGTTVEMARSRMNQITADLARAYPSWFDDRWVSVRPAADALVGDLRAPMQTLLIAVGLVLLIACANVANLVLARSTMRRREIAIRGALGASRWAIMRGVMVESLTLSTAGTLLGVLAAWWGVHAIMVLLPTSLPRLSDVGINVRVLIAAGLAAISTGLFFGLIPSWQLARQDLAATLGQSTTGVSAAGAGRRLRMAFIVCQVAIAVVLIVGAALFLASYARMMQVDTGLDYGQVVSVPLRLKLDFSTKERREAEYARGVAIVRAVRDRLQQLPGVESTAVMTGASLWDNGAAAASLSVPGREAFRPPENQVQLKNITPGYFKTVGVRVLRGRDFEPADGAAKATAILDDVAAMHFFGELDIVGREVQSSAGRRTVVGVVSGVRLDGPEGDIRPELYLPIDEQTSTAGSLFVRVASRTPASIDTITRTINDMRLDITASGAQLLSERFDTLVRPRTLNTVLVALFGALSLVIAAIGIYGVMAYIVAQRTGEIGIRMALGAQQVQIRRSVIIEASRLIAVGVAIGGIGAWILARLVGSLLFQVQARDPRLYALAITLFIAVGLLAAFIPARRASRVDPVVALRG
jgi:putative ABC transport system permease protein